MPQQCAGIMVKSIGTNHCSNIPVSYLLDLITPHLFIISISYLFVLNIDIFLQIFILFLHQLKLMIAKSPIAPFAQFVYTVQTSGLCLEGKKFIDKSMKIFPNLGLDFHNFQKDYHNILIATFLLIILCYFWACTKDKYFRPNIGAAMIEFNIHTI